MNIEEFEDNESSSDDSDFCPEKHQDSVSENSGPDEDDPERSDEENGTKRSKKGKKGSKRRKSKPKKETFEEEKVVDPEEEKRKADAIWEDFLNGTETPSDTPSEPKKVASSSRASSSSTIKTETVTSFKPSIPAKAPVECKIFEFAGDTVKLPSKSVEQQEQPIIKLPAPGVKRVAGGGLSSVLNQLTKKNKLTVLEKTKIDWDGFKDGEGISEELQTHNRGRDG